VILSEDTGEVRQREGPPPPFLQEPGYLVDRTGGERWLARAFNNFDRWRPGLLLVFTPLVVAAIGLAYFSRPGAEPLDNRTAAEGGSSAVEPLVDGVDGLPDDPAAVGVSAGGGAASTGTRQPSPVGGDPAPMLPPTTATPSPLPTPANTAPATPAEQPPGTVPATAATEPPTTAAPTTSEAPTTTAPPTSATIADPDSCRVTVSRQRTLRSEPTDSSPDAGQIPPGEYAVLGTTTSRFFFVRVTWYQLDAGGTVGWLEEQDVSSTQGDCGGRR
jgi:hypothetical protein